MLNSKHLNYDPKHDPYTLLPEPWTLYAKR